MLKYVLKKYINLLFLTCFLCLLSCTNSEIRKETNTDLSDTVFLRNGDLLFRMGTELSSYLARGKEENLYSHVAIAINIDSCWYAIHSSTGEEVDDRMSLHKIRDYYSQKMAVAGAFARVLVSDSESNNASQRALEKYKQGVIFDYDFDISDTTKLYCTELVRLVYIHLGIDITCGNQSEVTTLISPSGKAMLAKDILNCDNVSLISKF